MDARVATEEDLEPVTALLTAAFASDPLWSWAFPDPTDLEQWWRLHVRSALRFPSTWVLGDYAAVSLWIPPGESELTEAEEAGVEPLVSELVGSRAPESRATRATTRATSGVASAASAASTVPTNS